jgi:hypothetical protein
MTDAASAKLERLLAMAGRLNTALTLDVDALAHGRARELKMIEPEMQKVAALYEREAAGLSEREMEAAPAVLREKYLASVKMLRDLLKQQQRLLTRMRRVSEGMIRAVADELARRQASARPYSRSPATAAVTPGAMLYNQTA